MKEIAIAILVAVIFSTVLVTAIVVGTGKSEIAECTKWSQEADAYPGYFLASWQDQQCRANGIIINVPVVK